MLSFDHLRSCFMLDGVEVGQGVKPSDLARAIDVEITPMPGDADWSFVASSNMSIGVFATFYRHKMHSGYLWVYDASIDWDDTELAEQRRRSEHERIMKRLFGAPSFKSDTMQVELVRDPRNNLEQIAFSIVPRGRQSK